MQQAVGTPSVIRRNERYLVDSRSQIYEGDILETDDLSRARIRMIDNSTINVSSGTHMIFHQFSYTDPGRQVQARLTLSSGALELNAIDSLGARDNLAVSTPLAVIVGRKAHFWVGLVFGKNRLDVALFDGQSLTLSNDFGSGRIDQAGDGTTMTGGNSPQVATKWPDATLARARNTTRIDASPASR